MSSDDRATVLTDLALELQQAPDEDLTLKAIVGRSLELVQEADFVSLTLRARRRFLTPASTDELAVRADELQYALGEGPCVEAASVGEAWRRSGDVGSDGQWPTWGRRAAEELGVNSLLSVQLSAGDEPIGAINFYGLARGLFVDPETVDLALLYATHVAIALTSKRQVMGLRTAMQSRHMIGLAQGILMERFQLDMDRSFDLLRRYSNHLNMRVTDLAEELVRTRDLPRIPD